MVSSSSLSIEKMLQQTANDATTDATSPPVLDLAEAFYASDHKPDDEPSENPDSKPETSSTSHSDVTVESQPQNNSNNSNNNSVGSIVQATATSLENKVSLRVDWTHIPPPLSPIAQQLWDLQHNCSLPYMKYLWRDGFGGGYGIGSDMHAWGNALRAGMIHGHRISSPAKWIWTHQGHCTTEKSFHCYLGRSIEPKCSGGNTKELRGRIQAGACAMFRPPPEEYNFSLPDFRAAATEFAFSSVSPLVVQEAQRQALQVFRSSTIPSNLITVHVRWGDKAMEGSRKNQAIGRYIQAIRGLIEEEKLTSVHLLLCTEDPKALQAFQKAAPSDWNIYVDHFYTEYLPYRTNRTVVYNVPSHIAMETKGAAGLWAIGSILVAMEANYYVLTTKSNWSRLMNELRKNVIHPRCNNCTRMIDLEYGEC